MVVKGDRERRRLLMVALMAVAVAMLLLLGVTGQLDARPTACVVALDEATVDEVASHLARLQSALQSDEPLSGSRQDVLRLEELIDALSYAPRFGCEPTDVMPQFAW